MISGEGRTLHASAQLPRIRRAHSQDPTSTKGDIPENTGNPPGMLTSRILV